MNTIKQTRIWEALRTYGETGDFGLFCQTLEDLIFPTDAEILELALEIETAEVEQ